MRRTCTRSISRHISFEPARQAWGLDANLEMKAAFPLLHDGNLLPKMIRNLHDYQGRREFDGNHTLPVLPSKSAEGSSPHAWSQWDLTLNPNLLTDLAALQPTPQYVGPRTGYLFASIGWRSAGTSFKFTRSWGESRNWRPGEWAERNITPKWKLVPRIAAIHPDSRFQGKLQFVDVKLSEIVWAIDTNQLNPNEVLTLNILVANGVIPERDVVWPGVNLVYDLTSELRYPIHVELQNADDRAIAAIEEAGGTFTGTYMSIDGLYQEMRPEEFPVFSEQHLPDRPGFMHVASNPRVRGFLSQWHEEEGKYAHPGAGRRLSHYRRPPHARDFPATFEEYERVKHQQKWHLGQPGTGTVLPFVPSRAYEAHRPAVQRITESPA